MERTFGSSRLVLIEGDITRFAACAICNAANSQLAGGGGVDGAIHAAGGPSILAELDRIRARIGRCETGSAVATGAGDLEARFVFHAVGPIYRGGREGEPELLAGAYRACLDLADERDVRSIAFPSISTGIYGYPVAEAARIALATVSGHLSAGRTSIETATFVLFDRATADAYAGALEEI